MSPLADGGAFAVHLPRSQGLVIAGIRVQVGCASTEHVPREIRVMASSQRTAEAQSRWYDFVLSPEEQQMAALLGCVVVSVSSSYDSSNHPLIDSLDVFAVKEEDLTKQSAEKGTSSYPAKSQAQLVRGLMSCLTLACDAGAADPSIVPALKDSSLALL
ncbi:unnamed protein product, partial [Chrysoparadoxa australica]